MRILAVVLQIITLFMLTGCGAFLRKKQVLTEPVIKGINSTVMTVAWPAMVLMSTQKQLSPEMLPGFFRVLIMTTAIIAVTSIVLFFCCKKHIKQSSLPVFVALCALPNAGFVGMPIVSAFYGDSGITYLAAYIIGFNLVLWSMYLFIYGIKNDHPIRTFLNANIIAGLIAITLFALQIRIPDPFFSFLNQLSSLTTPLTMLLLGSRLIESLKGKKLMDKTLISALLIRLLIFPLLTYAIGRVLGMGGTELGVLVLAGAMPAASTSQMFAEKYDKDIGLAAQGISLSLLLCIATIPLILLITQL